MLGEGYAGVLERDGWAPYRGFAHARHQTCLAHLLRHVGLPTASSALPPAEIAAAPARTRTAVLAARASASPARAGPRPPAREDSTFKSS